MSAQRLPENPYVGPRAFQTGERLYGREREVDRLLNVLIAERIVLLYSPSGAGKTSLIQAALIPALRQEDFRVLPVMRVSTETRDLLATTELGEPRPLAATPSRVDSSDLLSMLLSAAPAPAPAPSASARHGAPNRYVLSALLALEAERPPAQQLQLAELARLTLPEYLRRRITSTERSSGVVLIFDQFEEILTIEPANQAAKTEFFTQVGEALRDRQYWALFALREDYIAGLDPYVRPIPTRFSTSFRLDLLGIAAARLAIQRPSRRNQVDFTAAAAAKLVDDLRRTRIQRVDGGVEEQLGPYVEPVQLQVVCYRLWEQLRAGPGSAGFAAITEADVALVGDVNTALAGYYAEQLQATAAATGVSERALRDWFDRQLITEQGLRGQVLRGRVSSQGLDNRAIERLIDAHLIRAEKRGGAIWFELTHDRLIEPIRADNAAWRDAHLSTLQRQADLWERQQRPSGLLLRDTALAEAEIWAADHPNEMTAVEQAFLQDCQSARAAAARERRTYRIIRVLAFGAATLALAAVLAMSYALNRRNEAIREQERALAAQATSVARREMAEHERQSAMSNLAQFLATQAQSEVAYDPELSLLLAVEAARRDHGPFVEYVLRHIVPQVCTQVYPLPGEVLGAAYSPDGRWIATAGADGKLRVWDASTGKLLTTSNEGHIGRANSVTFSSDGRRIVTAGSDSAARVWEASDSTVIRTLTGHAGSVSSAAFSPNGRWIVTASADRTARVWDAETGEQLRVLNGHDGAVTSAVFSPDGTLILSASLDGSARLWDAAHGQELRVLRGAAGAITSAAFSPTGKQLVTTDDDGLAQLWDAADGKQLLTLRGHAGEVTSAAFSPDGTRVATAGVDGTVRVWDAATGDQIGVLRGHTGAVRDVSFSSGGLCIVTAGADATMREWQLNLPVLRGHEGAVNGGRFSPDGQRIVTAGSDGMARVWSASSGAEQHMLDGHAGPVTSAAFSPSGAQIVTAGADGTARLWDAASGRELQVIRGHTGAVTSAAFSTSGAQIVTAGADGTARLWDAASGRELRVIRGHTGAVTSAAFSPSGEQIVTAGADATARVWDTDSGRELLVIREPVDGMWRAAYSLEGQCIVTASGGGTARIWDASNGKQLHVLIGHTQRVVSAVFSADGKRILTGSWDGTVRLWDAETAAELLKIDGYNDVVTDAAMSQDGRLILTTSADGTARLDYASFEDVLARARQLMTRELTLEERKTYLGAP